jgi:hypothetical protein
MAMKKLEGSCRCGAVEFEVGSHTPHPFMRCYCSICRKTAGAGGYAINIMGEMDTFSIKKGEAHVRIYRAILEEDGEEVESTSRRHFCELCGTALWMYDPTWPQWIYPHASAIDTPLPAPPERVHMMLGSKASWVVVPRGPKETHFDEFPEESIEGWHKKRGLYED